MPCETDTLPKAASYIALRASRAPATTTWWTAAHAERHAPPPIAALLMGRERVEVTGDELDGALAWAARLPGWDDASPRAVWAYRPGP